MSTSIRFFIILIASAVLAGSPIRRADADEKPVVPKGIQFTGICESLLRSDFVLAPRLYHTWKKFEDAYNSQTKTLNSKVVHGLRIGPELELTENASLHLDPHHILVEALNNEYRGWESRDIDLDVPNIYNTVETFNYGIDHYINEFDDEAIHFIIHEITRALDTSVDSNTILTYIEADNLIAISKKVRAYAETTITDPQKRKEILAAIDHLYSRAKDMKLASTIFTFIIIFSVGNPAQHIGLENLQFILRSPTGLKYVHSTVISALDLLFHPSSKGDFVLHEILEDQFTAAIRFHEKRHWLDVDADVIQAIYDHEDRINKGMDKAASGEN